MISIIYDIRGGDETAEVCSKLSRFKLVDETVSLWDLNGELFYKGPFKQNTYDLKTDLYKAMMDTVIITVHGDNRYFKKDL